MKAALTHTHLAKYGDMLSGLIDAAEEQANGVVRKPRREIQDFVDALVDVCAVLNYQFAGKRLFDRWDLEQARRRAIRTQEFVRRCEARHMSAPNSSRRSSVDVSSARSASEPIARLQRRPQTCVAQGASDVLARTDSL